MRGSLGARFDLILRKLLPYLRRRASEDFVTLALARALGLEPRSAGELLKRHIGWPARSGERAMAAFLDPPFTASGAKLSLTEAEFRDQFATYRLLHKVVLLLGKLRMAPDDIAMLLSEVDWSGLSALPLDASRSGEEHYPVWRRLAELARLRDEWPSGGEMLRAVFVAATRSASVTPIRQLVAAALQWDPKDVEYAVHADRLKLVSLGDYRDARKLAQLKACLDLLRKLGVSASQAWPWGEDSLDSGDAAAVRQAVRARFDTSTWLQRARALRDPLRERQRAALVAYLVAKDRLRDANDLYGRYLIDVEMDPCMMTSRIKQAISSVQLFVQRCLMNLEARCSGEHHRPRPVEVDEGVPGLGGEPQGLRLSGELDPAAAAGRQIPVLPRLRE